MCRPLQITEGPSTKKLNKLAKGDEIYFVAPPWNKIEAIIVEKGIPDRDGWVRLELEITKLDGMKVSYEKKSDVFYLSRETRGAFFLNRE